MSWSEPSAGRDLTRWEGLLQKKSKAVQEFLSLTRFLRERVEAQDLEAVNLLLDRRRGSIRTLRGIDEHLEKVRPRGWPADPSGERLRPLWQQITRSLQEAADLDRECTGRMAAWHESLREELLRLRRGAKTARRYAPRAAERPRFLDVIK